jgi:hypothetical protein
MRGQTIPRRFLNMGLTLLLFAGLATGAVLLLFTGYSGLPHLRRVQFALATKVRGNRLRPNWSQRSCRCVGGKRNSCRWT